MFSLLLQLFATHYVVVTRPTPRNKGMTEDHGGQKPDNATRTGLKIINRVAKNRAAWSPEQIQNEKKSAESGDHRR